MTSDTSSKLDAAKMHEHVAHQGPHDHGAHAGHAQSLPTSATKAGSKDIEYTCPMHPQVRQMGPGNCPICGMPLEPVLAMDQTGDSPELRDMTRRSDSRIRNQDIDRPKLCANLTGRGFHRVRVANVGRERSRLAAAHANRINDLFEQVLSSGQQPQLCAAGGKLRCQTFTDTGRGSGYHHGLVCPKAGFIGHFPFAVCHLSFRR